MSHIWSNFEIIENRCWIYDNAKSFRNGSFFVESKSLNGFETKIYIFCYIKIRSNCRLQWKPIWADQEINKLIAIREVVKKITQWLNFDFITTTLYGHSSNGYVLIDDVLCNHIRLSSSFPISGIDWSWFLCLASKQFFHLLVSYVARIVSNFDYGIPHFDSSSPAEEFGIKRNSSPGPCIGKNCPWFACYIQICVVPQAVGWGPAGCVGLHGIEELHFWNLFLFTLQRWSVISFSRTRRSRSRSRRSRSKTTVLGQKILNPAWKLTLI